MLSKEVQEPNRAYVNGRFSLKDRMVESVLCPIWFMGERLVGVSRVACGVVETYFFNGRGTAAEGAILGQGDDSHRQAVFMGR